MVCQKRNERIHALRILMSQHNIDGYMIPSTDEFNNEYIPNSAKRLEWLSGFSGSNGIAIITADKCYLYTDGRYLLQAAQQLSEHFEVLDIATFSSTILNINTLGFDPMLHTYAAIEKHKTNYNLTAIPQNLIDVLWHDKPEKPSAKYYKYDDVMQHRIKEALRHMHPKAELLLISAPDQLCWLAGIRGSDVEYTPLALYYGLLSRDGFLQKFKDHDGLQRYLNSTTHTVQVDHAQTPYAIALSIKENNRIFQQNPIDKLRLPKTEAQLDSIRLAHVYDGVAMCNFLHWFSKQTRSFTEYELSQNLLDHRKAMPHFHSLSFATICGFAKNGAIIHYQPSSQNSKLVKGDGLLLIDSGAQYKIGTTDITRVLPIGNIDPVWKKHYTMVLKSHIDLASATFPVGTTGAQLDGIARASLWEHGLDYPHGTGHGVGFFLSVHEGDLRISKACNQPVVKNAVLSNEPGLYFAEQYGIRLENLMAVVDNDISNFLSFETLTMVPFDKTLIDRGLLSEKQLSWLDNYHHKVFATLAPHLSEEVKLWLQEQIAL